MSPFWTGFCQQFKECGRGTTSFVLTVATLLALFIAGIIIDKTEPNPKVLAGIAALVALPFAVVVYRAWKRRRERLNFSPLSSDELVRARSKLKNGFAAPTPFKTARAQRPPDTDLKF